jgi:hypothetical protein
MQREERKGKEERGEMAFRYYSGKEAAFPDVAWETGVILALTCSSTILPAFIWYNQMKLFLAFNSDLITPFFILEKHLPQSRSTCSWLFPSLALVEIATEASTFLI